MSSTPREQPSPRSPLPHQHPPSQPGRLGVWPSLHADSTVNATSGSMDDHHFSNNPFHLDNASKAFAKRYRTEIAASAASLSSTLIAYPLDTVKTRLQTIRTFNLTSCLHNLWVKEGVDGAFRGVLAPLASITVVRTLSFSMYQKTKYTLDGVIENATGHSPLVHANTRGAWPNLGTIACFGTAGATAGFCVTAIACPFELSKLRSQLAHLIEVGPNGTRSKDAPKHTGAIKFMAHQLKTRGLPGIYAGFRLHLIRDTIGTSVYFMTYESSKQILANARGNSPVTPTAVVIAGGMCGLFSWAAIYPIDTVKANYQKAVLSGKKPPPARIVYSKEMYRGISVSMARSALINAIFFSIFEFTKKRINNLEFEDEETT